MKEDRQTDISRLSKKERISRIYNMKRNINMLTNLQGRNSVKQIIMVYEKYV